MAEERKGEFFQRLKGGLSKTRTLLFTDVSELVGGRKKIDVDTLEELETRLLMADVGMETTTEVMQQLQQRLARQQGTDMAALLTILRGLLIDQLSPYSQPLHTDSARPYMVMVLGVNGAGKTTTIGKLAHHLRGQGHSVMLAAGDTFRAAAIEQLKVWGERVQSPVIAQHLGADSASVVFDAAQAATSRKSDVLIADTAGRLHTQANLMDELKKIKRVVAKVNSDFPHETLLVIDASTGQNGLSQAQTFHEAIGISGMVLTKLDGTAKGGIIFAITRRLQLPVRFIGVGEGIEDLQPFAADAFVDALLGL